MIQVPIHPESYRLYEAAVRLITKKIGEAAPSPIALIQHELSMREPRLIADEYLEGRRRIRNRTRRGAASKRPASTQ